ncbi:MAG: hypothetical protein RLZZ53_806 [Acidobacteriota bacterium]|jgi:high-affinity nickel-transport protein
MTETLATLAASGLGIAIGLRHSFEPDHLMAVAAMVAPQRDTKTAVRFGASWGIGHTLSLFVVGLTLAFARAAMPPRVSLIFETIVAAMIVAIGIDAVRRGWLMRGRQASLDQPTAHAAIGPHVHVGPFTLARQPLMVGVVHGLSGSGALTALALSTLPTLASQIVFMLLFGLGSTVGMGIAAGVAGWSLARVVQKPAISALLGVVAGLIAIVFGMVYGQPLLAELLAG